MEAKGQLYHVGACFEALFMGVLTAVSNLGYIFFRILTSGLEQCELNIYIVESLIDAVMGSIIGLCNCATCNNVFHHHKNWPQAQSYTLSKPYPATIPAN